jgi:hypothetical protein
MLTLQVQPELRARAKPMAQPQSRIARNGALALDDLADPVRRNLDPTRQSAGGQAELGKLIAQNFTGWMGWRGMMPIISLFCQSRQQNLGSLTST